MAARREPSLARKAATEPMKAPAHPPWRLDDFAHVNAADVLPALAERFLANGGKAARTGTSDAKLHAFRLRAKEFRYTLEAFRPFYGPALDRHIAHVREIQNLLGAVNDCRATADLLLRLEAVAAVEVEQLRQFLMRRRAKLREEFRAAWDELYGGERQRRVLVRYLRQTPATYCSSTAKSGKLL